MPRRCSVASLSCFFMRWEKVGFKPAASTRRSQQGPPSGPPRAWSRRRRARGRLILPSRSMIRQSSIPSASRNFVLPSVSSMQQVRQSKMFSTYSSSSVPFAGSRFLYELSSWRNVSMPSREMSFARLVIDDCRSMARSSAEYCLF